MSGFNRCDDCGQFKPWADLSEEEYSSLDLGGHLTQEWRLECKECRGVYAGTEAR